MVKIVQYNLFDLISFKDDNDGINRDDIIVSFNIESFIVQLRNIPMKKLDYLKYWNRTEHQIKNVLDTYEEIISKTYVIESEANKIHDELGYNVYVLRMKDKKPNYLKQSDVDVDIERIRNDIQIQLDYSVKQFDKKFNEKLDNLFKRTEIALTRSYEYVVQKNTNPNLRVQNKTGYSLSEIYI